MAGGQHKNANNPDSNVRVEKDLIKEVMKLSALTGHSAKMFIEECIKACLEQIHADGEVMPVPALVTFARTKLGKNTLPLKEQVKEWVEELHHQPAPRQPDQKKAAK